MAEATMKLGDYMTPSPLSVQIDEPVTEAMSIMEQKRIRHLLVFEKDCLVGIVSDRDLQSANLKSPTVPAVRNYMTNAPYAVSCNEDLEAVLSEMIEYKYGSAVVLNEENQIVGIFTTIDALRLFRDLIREKKKISI